MLFTDIPIIIMGMPAESIPLKLNDANLQRLIHEAAADTARVYFPKHATQRMRERAIAYPGLRVFEARLGVGAGAYESARQLAMHVEMASCG